MKSLVIREQSHIRDLLDWLGQGIPRRLLFVQPRAIAWPSDGPSADGPNIRIMVAPELILRRTLSLPQKGKHQLPHAIELMIESETPFSAAELLVHADQMRPQPGDTEARYVVRMIPRSIIEDISKGLGIHRRNILGITDANAPERVEFSGAAFPRRELLKWLPWIPLAVAVAAVATLGYQALAAQRDRVAALQTATTEHMSELQRVSGALQKLSSSAEGEQTVADALRVAPSAFNTLQGLQRQLPDDTTLLRVQLSGAELRLAVRAADVLSTTLSMSKHGWLAEIEGPITVDLSTGQEQATILLRNAEPRA